MTTKILLGLLLPLLPLLIHYSKDATLYFNKKAIDHKKGLILWFIVAIAASLANHPYHWQTFLLCIAYSGFFNYIFNELVLNVSPWYLSDRGLDKFEKKYFNRYLALGIRVLFLTASMVIYYNKLKNS